MMDASEEYKRGVMSVVGPAVGECESSMRTLIESQQTLSNQVDAVSAKLAKMFESEDGAPPFGTYAQKLAVTKKRISSTNMTAVAIAERLNRIDVLVQTSPQIQSLLASRQEHGGKGTWQGAVQGLSPSDANDAEADGSDGVVEDEQAGKGKIPTQQDVTESQTEKPDKVEAQPKQKDDETEEESREQDDAGDDAAKA